MQRGQRPAVSSEEHLIIDRAAAVVFSGVVGIVFNRIAGRPAAAELLPQLAVGYPLRGVGVAGLAGNIAYAPSQ